MSETDFNANQDPANQPAPVKAKTKRRLILKLLGGALLLLFLLILALPTLLSSGPVLSIILGKVNGQLNGKIEVSSLSLGWFSGVKLQGVRVFDSTNAQIAQLDRLTVPLPLWKAALGKYDLGEVICDGLSFNAKYDDQHRLNFAQLVKQSALPVSTSPPATPTAPPTPPGESKPTRLPNISGDIKITNCQGTISQPGKPAVYLMKLNGHIAIPSINDPITDQIDAAIRVGDLKEGAISTSGTAAVVKDNQVNIGAGVVHQKLDILDVDLSAFKPFLTDVDTLAGTLGVHGSVDLLNGPSPGGLQLTVTARNVKYAKTTGPRADEPLVQLDVKGDSFGSEKSTLDAIKNLTVKLTAGDSGAPTIDLLAEVPQATLNGTTAVEFKLTHLSADLVKLQKEFAAVPAGQAGTVVNSGLLQIASAGKYDGHQLTVDSFTIDADKLFVNRQLKGRQQVNALAGESLKVNAAASVNLPKADGGDTSVNIKTLSVTDAGQIVDIHKNTTGDFVLTLPSKGGASGHGEISLALQLGSLNQIASVLTQTDANPAPGGLHSGKLSGDVSLVPSTGEKTSFAANLDVTDLAINSTNGVVAIQPVHLALNASADQSAGSIVVDKAALTSSIANVSLTSPIVVTTANDKTSINGGVKVDGDIANLTSTLAAYKGEKTDAYPYRGTYSLSENITSSGETLSLKGALNINDFQSYNATGTTFSEKLLAIANDLSLTSARDDEALAINALTIAMQSSGALNVAINNGTIHHLQTTRDLKLQPTMDYDLAKLWPVIQPMMGDDYKTLKITGQFKKQFNITGSYPADQPSTTAIKSLHADGDLAVATFDYDGLNLQNFIVPFSLDNGKLVTVYANKPAGQNTAAPAVANGGTLDLSNLTVDLTQDPPRLYVPANKLLISKFTINSLFANSFLAKYLDNPVFTGNNNATGLLDLTLMDSDALPLGKLVTQAVPANAGKADIKFSLSELHIGFQGISGLASALKQDSFAANVKDGTVAVAKGLSTEHINFASGSYSINFDGTVRLADEAFVPMNLSVGPLTSLVDKSFGVHDQNVLKYLPDRVTVPVQGTVHHAYVPLDKALGKLLGDAGAKAITNGLLGGDKNGNGGSGSDALGGLLNKLQKKKN